MGNMINGQFWLPGNEDQKISGTLQVSVNGLSELDLFGVFDEINGFGNYSIILGITPKGRVTLHNCINTGESFSIFTHAYVSFKVTLVLIGSHFNSFDEIGFSKYKFRVTNLNNWTNISGITTTSQQDSLSTEIVTFIEPKDILLASVNNLEIYLSNSFSKSFSTSHLYKSISWKEGSFLYIQKLDQTKITFNDFYYVYLPIIQNFFTFSVGSPVFPNEIFGFYENVKSDEDSELELIENMFGTKILFKIPHIPEEYETIHGMEMRLPYSKIKKHTDEIINNWFVINEKYSAIFELFFGTMYNSSLYPQNKFLSNMQALESYHRIAFGAGESIMSIDKYNDLQRKLFKVIESNLDEETSGNFKNKFTYLNDTTLRKRLKHLIDENKERLQKLFKVNRNFIDELVETRNNMTHIDNNDHRKDKLNRLELARLINKSTTILELCLFNELGVSDDIKDSFISGLKQTRHF